MNNAKHCKLSRRYTEEYIQQLFILNQEKSLTSRRKSQFIPSIVE